MSEFSRGRRPFCARQINRPRIILTAVAAAGILLAAWLAASGVFATGNNSMAMETTYRNYDWGVTKPGGQKEEDRHRKHLNSQFRAYTHDQGDLVGFSVYLPNPLNIRGGEIAQSGKGDLVVYNLERVFHKYVDSKQDCNNKLTDSALMLQDSSGPDEQRVSPTHSVAPGKFSQGKVDIYVEKTGVNGDQYSCLVVKLKGAIWRSPDTHPEWAFVSPKPVSRQSESAAPPAAWPEIRVVSDERGARAYSLAGASGLRFYWKHRVQEKTDSCDQSTFAVGPNHPSIHHSSQFNMPHPQHARAYYKNRYVCFQATIVNIDHPNYSPGASLYRYGRVSLRPAPNQLVVSAVNFAATSNKNHHALALEIDSSKVVTYRFGWLESWPLLSQTTCQRLFETPGDLQDPDTISFEDKSFGLTNKHRQLIRLEIERPTSQISRTMYAVPRMCLEATDDAGNKVYAKLPNFLWRDPKISLGREMRLGGTELIAWIEGTTGTIAWEATTFPEGKTCEASRFGGEPVAVLPSNQRLEIEIEDTDNIYYCFRATDELGNVFYTPSVRFYPWFDKISSPLDPDSVINQNLSS